jgi:hypothetical protein
MERRLLIEGRQVRVLVVSRVHVIRRKRLADFYFFRSNTATYTEVAEARLVVV